AAATGSDRVLLYLHGGSYLFCSPATHRSITFSLAEQASARVFALDYRLAPEDPFPAAVEDAVAALRALRSIGVDPSRVVVAGDSAGGGLALSALLALRDAGDPLPAAAILFSPWTDLAVTGASISDPRYRNFLRRMAKLYLADAPDTDPLASPLYANLRGLPPLLIHASEGEMLRDDSTRLATAALDAGVAATLELWPTSLPHAWHVFAPFLPEGREALARAAAFIRS